MKIIIVGCGKVGSSLASNLSNENHDIVVIDKNEKYVNNVISSVDCMGVVGNGAIQSVLLEAGVDKCDFLIACTDSDEINILTCLIARKSSKCRTAARIRNPEYAKQIEYIMNELDISLTINPDLATAREIVRIVRYSNSLSSDAFFKGRLNLLKLNIPDDSSIINKKLYELKNIFNLKVVICAIERDNDVIIPTGGTEILKGDKIFFVVDTKNAFLLFERLGIDYKIVKSFILIGASRVTEYLIQILEKYIDNCNIKLIDNNREKCEQFAELFPNISVVCDDATDKSVLIKEGLEDVDCFITLTGTDEENILLSLYAETYESIKSITKINHINFIDSLKDIKLGSIVNPERVANNIIISYVRALTGDGKSNIETLYRLCNDRIEGLGFKIKKESEVTNIKLRNLHIKPNVIIAGINRKGEILIPNGEDTLEVGDSVVVISKDNKLNDITDILV